MRNLGRITLQCLRRHRACIAPFATFEWFWLRFILFHHIFVAHRWVPQNVAVNVRMRTENNILVLCYFTSHTSLLKLLDWVEFFYFFFCFLSLLDA